MISPQFHIPYLLPTVLLAVALASKLPTSVRTWRDPEVRAITLMLFWATACLVILVPVNIDLINRVTGVPNLAAPFAYTFLTAFCATSLTMIMRWREEPSARRRRRIRLIYAIYTGIVAAIWVTFVVGDAPTPRIYDFDTYYATTPWIRELVLLYVVAHLVSCLVAAAMLWKWFPEIENRWLRSSVICLQLGFATGLVFDATKLTAVTARWAGADLDELSTVAAPPFALAEAVLVAVGFIAPQIGPFLQRWARDQRDHRRLRPLWRAVRPLGPGAADARIGPFAPVDLRLLQRRQRIHDALRILAPYYDTALYQRAHRAAAKEHPDPKARAVAGAVALQSAIGACRDSTPLTAGARPSRVGPEISDQIDAISQALHHTRLVHSVHRLATSTESVTSDV
ncbi:MAB_1171c family putative transporter [Streptomyces sp. NPDC088789]|uniref:MAB_1171c family putative transporter n=1 Tax=Streptomyces sp. NPDC088789 TaxID=3365899 RepID=UPI00380B45E4